MSDYIALLETQSKRQWPTINEGFLRSKNRINEIISNVSPLLAPEASFVIFGSLARGEHTQGSDLDWGLLIDGEAKNDHNDLVREIKGRLSSIVKAPSEGGAFGKIISPHPILHQIGGDDDSNKNITNRILLLLESVSINQEGYDGYKSAHHRIIKEILSRYFTPEAHFREGDVIYPRFLINDIVRYWRTMAVDYAAKVHSRGTKGWAIRNIKLRFSRKLLFVVGLLLCHETSLFTSSELIPQLGLFDSSTSFSDPVERCAALLRINPLERLARAIVHSKIDEAVYVKALDCYEFFLSSIASEPIRAHLEQLSPDKAINDEIFQSLREHGKIFQDALSGIFLDKSNLLGQLTLQYGVF